MTEFDDGKSVLPLFCYIYKLFNLFGFQQKRNDILNTSIQTRSKAHNIIRRMLASLGDPYTRFLSPAEVT